MRFCSVVNCIDGRVQLPVIRYLQERFRADYVDCITEAGPNLILAEEAEDSVSVEAILDRLDISIEKHSSVGIAVAGHHDCAANPAPQDDQIVHIKEAVQFLRQCYHNIEIIGLWVDRDFEVHEVIESQVDS